MRLRRASLVTVGLTVALALVAVGARAIGVAESSQLMPPAAILLAFVFGVWMPLAVLLYAVQRQRIAVVALAFCVGLSVNVFFLSHATPANAAADNTSDFYLSGTNGTTFGCSGQKDMYQYAPVDNTNGQAYYSSGQGSGHTFCSDTFAAGQALTAGTTVANMYFANSSGTKDCAISTELFWYHASSSTRTSLGAGNTIIPADNAAATLFTWSWATSAVTAFETGDRLEYTVTFTSSGTNCNNTAFNAAWVSFASRITVATIVPEGVAGFLLLAPALPLAIRWWHRRRP